MRTKVPVTSVVRPYLEAASAPQGAPMAWMQQAKGTLVDLDQETCWRVVRFHRLGRLAWCGPTGPRLVLLNYAAQDDRLWFRCAPYSELARECRDRPVVMEVDDVDDVRRTGNSVLVHGIARFEEAPRTAPEIDPWPAGQRSLRVSVAVSSVSGRRLLAGGA